MLLLCLKKYPVYARAVSESDNDLMESREILNEMGIRTEFDIEEERYGS